METGPWEDCIGRANHTCDRVEHGKLKLAPNTLYRAFPNDLGPLTSQQQQADEGRRPRCKAPPSQGCLSLVSSGVPDLYSLQGKVHTGALSRRRARRNLQLCLKGQQKGCQGFTTRATAILPLFSILSFWPTSNTMAGNSNSSTTGPAGT